MATSLADAFKAGKALIGAVRTIEKGPIGQADSYLVIISEVADGDKVVAAMTAHALKEAGATGAYIKAALDMWDDIQK
jgi:hypothetical protein